MASPPGKKGGCPCCDEDDDGVPDFCRHERCPLDPRHRCLGNRNPLCLMFGNVGWKFFDQNRKPTMGLAMGVTIVAIIFTTFGCFALSPIDRIVRVTHWEKIVADISKMPQQDDAQHSPAIKLYIGLSTMVIVECSNVAAATKWGTVECDWEGRSRMYWNSDSCTDQQSSFDSAVQNGASSHELATLIMCEEDSDLKECSEMLADPFTIQLGAFMSCATLIFALMGTINRYKKKSDVPQQKLLGCLTDTWGALSLLLSVLAFDNACYYTGAGGNHLAHHNIALTYYHGPGILCYYMCVITGIIRAICHWLTPLPGLGAGACTFRLPHVFSDAMIGMLDVNGDGIIDISDIMHLLDSQHAGKLVQPHEIAMLSQHIARSVSVGAGGAVHRVNDLVHDVEHNAAVLAHRAGDFAVHEIHELEHNAAVLAHKAGDFAMHQLHDFEHFIHGTEHSAAELAKMKLKRMLHFMDADGSGRLDLNDLRALGSGFRDRLDIDGDGKLDCNDVWACCCGAGSHSAKVGDAEETEPEEAAEIPESPAPTETPLPRSPLVAKLKPIAGPRVLSADPTRWSQTQPAFAREPFGSISLPTMPPKLELEMSRGESVELMLAAGQKKKKRKKRRKDKDRASSEPPSRPRCLKFAGREMEDGRRRHRPRVTPSSREEDEDVAAEGALGEEDPTATAGQSPL